jgi:hypothetical protein
MHDKIVGYRRRYGDNWLTVFPDGLEIPWRQLTLQEFLDYDDLFRSGRYTAVEVEDEIFQLAVLESLYTDNLDILPAGIVSVVVAQILYVSGPSSPEQIGNDLNIARTQVQDFISSAVTLICSVYPAYKPDEVFNLKYDVFMRRLAMAEKRLLELGILREPLTVELAQPDGTVQAQQPPQELPSQKKRREILEAQRKKIDSKLKDLNEDTKHPEGVITQDKMRDSGLTFVPDLSNDPRDYELNKLKTEKAKKEAVQGLEAIYPEYFKMMKEGKKLTPDTIQQVKGSSKEEVKERHKEYIDKVVSGEIKIPAPVQEPIKPKTPGKIKVKRR